MPRLAKALLLAMSLGVLSAPAARASEEFGDRCVANEAVMGWTAIVDNNGQHSFPLQPVARPEQNSVITRWKAVLAPGTGPIRQQLLAFRQVGEGDERLIGESATETLVDGPNEFPTRIPIPEYGRIGLNGPDRTLLCKEEDGRLAGLVENPFALGETRRIKVADFGVPAVAVIEPDRDGDGWGDETQDQCPVSSAFHGVCPVVSFSAGHVKVKQRAILVDVSIGVTTTTYATPYVSVYGEIPVRGRPEPIRIEGGTREVPVGGGVATFRLPLPPGLVRRLARLIPKRFVTIQMRAVTVNASDVAGRDMSRAWTVKLHGRRRAGRRA